MSFVLRRLEKKISKKMGFEPDFTSQNKESKAKVSIDKMPYSGQNKGDTSNLGEYVDYEEID